MATTRRTTAKPNAARKTANQTSRRAPATRPAAARLAASPVPRARKTKAGTLKSAAAPLRHVLAIDTCSDPATALFAASRAHLYEESAANVRWTLLQGSQATTARMLAAIAAVKAAGGAITGIVISAHGAPGVVFAPNSPHGVLISEQMPAARLRQLVGGALVYVCGCAVADSPTFVQKLRAAGASGVVAFRESLLWTTPNSGDPWLRVDAELVTAVARGASRQEFEAIRAHAMEWCSNELHSLSGNPLTDVNNLIAALQTMTLDL